MKEPDEVVIDIIQAWAEKKGQLIIIWIQSDTSSFLLILFSKK